MPTPQLLVAEFADASSGRAAVVDLERRGMIDADRMTLEGIDTVDEGERRESDRTTGRFLARRAVVGGAIGTASGAIVGFSAAALLGLDPQPAGPIAAGLGGGAFVGALGVFWGVGLRLPVTESAVEASDLPGHPVRLVVRLDPGRDEGAVRPHLEAAGARSVQSS